MRGSHWGDPFTFPLWLGWWTENLTSRKGRKGKQMWHLSNTPQPPTSRENNRSYFPHLKYQITTALGSFSNLGQHFRRARPTTFALHSFKKEPQLKLQCQERGKGEGGMKGICSWKLAQHTLEATLVNQPPDTWALGTLSRAGHGSVPLGPQTRNKPSFLLCTWL